MSIRLKDAARIRHVTPVPTSRLGQAESPCGTHVNAVELIQISDGEGGRIIGNRLIIGCNKSAVDNIIQGC